MGDPTPLSVIVEGVPDATELAPCSLAFVRVPHDVEAELAYARAVGAPEFAGYEAELRHGLYRGALADFEAGAFTLDSYYHLPRPPA
jgi:hypothetical protein